jgi:hypothetical protein
MQKFKSRAPLDLGIANTFVQWTRWLASGLIAKGQFPPSQSYRTLADVDQTV